MPDTPETLDAEQNADSSRRNFLKTAGKIGLIVPPAMVILLSTSMDAEAIASSSEHDC